MKKSGIREWAVVEEIAAAGDDVTVIGKTVRVGAKLEVKQPVFNDGNRGRPILELTLFKDSWTFRFRIDREGGDEATAASNVLSTVCAAIPEGRAKLEETWAAYEKERKRQMDKRIKEHNEVLEDERKRGGRKSKKAGQGLGRFSKPGKTRRNKAKKRGESRAQ